MPVKTLPSFAYLHACFDYSPVTGELRWKRRPQEHFATINAKASFDANYAGKVAGCPRERSRGVKINGQRYKAHRIIWKMATGEDPIDTIDHRNGNPFKNAYENLRVATRGQQAWNRKRPKTNTSGYRGATWHRKSKKWIASIVHDGTRYHIGQFDTAKEAGIAYENKSRILRGSFYRSSTQTEK
jgi:hypothetical protein